MSSAPVGPSGPGRPRKSGAKAAAGSGSPASAASAPQPGASTAGALSSALAQLQAAAGEPDGLPRDRKMLRVHVEQTLLGLFGHALALEPRFQDIIDQTVDALLAEPSLGVVVRAACAELADAARH
jgi:hypothetical protein